MQIFVSGLPLEGDSRAPPRLPCDQVHSEVERLKQCKEPQEANVARETEEAVNRALSHSHNVALWRRSDVGPLLLCNRPRDTAMQLLLVSSFGQVYRRGMSSLIEKIRSWLKGNKKS